MKLDFSNLGQVFFTISNLFPVRQTSVGKTSFTMHNPRHTDALLLFSGCTSICYQKGEPPIYIPQGALVYMPKNSRYMWEDTPALSGFVSEKLLFEFTLNYAETERRQNEKCDFCVNSTLGERISLGDKVAIVTTSHKSLYERLLGELIETFNKSNTSVLEVYCKAYEIFRVVANDCESRKSVSGIETIAEGIRLIEDNPLGEVSVREAAEASGVCIGYFERVFKKYAGVTPTEYRNARKIFYIKSLLQDKKATLDEVAERTGYCDSGYLCRIFKKKTGMTPTEYRKLFFSQSF